MFNGSWMAREKGKAAFTLLTRHCTPHFFKKPPTTALNPARLYLFIIARANSIARLCQYEKSLHLLFVMSRIIRRKFLNLFATQDKTRRREFHLPRRKLRNSSRGSSSSTWKMKRQQSSTCVCSESIDRGWWEELNLAVTFPSITCHNINLS